MKLDLQAKFLQHLNKKKQDDGFTLIELLVVIIIIGILAAIALPSFLNQANKAKQSEAKTYVGSTNRAQQAYYLENDAFVTSEQAIGDLGLGVATQTAYYVYKIDETAVGQVNNRAIPVNKAGTPSSLKSYLGGVQIGKIAGTGEATTLAILCEAKDAPITGGDDATTTPITFGDPATGTPPECPAGTFRNLGKK
jgi:prepilin-type N-terminal cleavage/methylation domain-containing protein